MQVPVVPKILVQYAIVTDDGPSYPELVRRSGRVVGWLEGRVGFRGGFWLGRRVVLWGHPRRIVQRVVRIDSNGFSEDFRNEIRFGRLRRQGDRSLFEDVFEVGDLEGFPDTPRVRVHRGRFLFKDSQFGFHRRPWSEKRNVTVGGVLCVT